MANFLIDEDLPRSTGEELIKTGHKATDVRNIGLRGESDDKIFAYTQENNLILLFGDLGFANTIRFPLGSHKGIVILRFPNEISTGALNQELLKSLSDLEDKDINGNLVIIELGKIRIRKSS